MDKQQIIAYLKENNVDKIKFAFADIDGILRGKIIGAEKFTDGLQDGYGFCDVVFGWDSSDTSSSPTPRTRPSCSTHCGRGPKDSTPRSTTVVTLGR